MLRIIHDKREFKFLNMYSSKKNAPFVMKNNFPHRGIGNFIADKLTSVSKENSDYKNILDIGCGTGWLKDKIPNGLSYIGLDNCSYFIEELSKNTNCFYTLDIEAPHSIDSINEFRSDIIVCCLSLIEIPYLKDAFRNLSLLCNPGGNLLIVGLDPVIELHRISKDTDQFYYYLDMYLNNSDKLTISKKIKSKGEISRGDYHRILYSQKDYHQLAKKNNFVLEESDQIRNVEFKRGDPIYNYMLFKREE